MNRKGTAKCSSDDKNTQAKALFSQVWDLSKQIERNHATVRHISDFFSQENAAFRRKLRDKCERLLQMPNVSYQRKTEELLWKKGFYDVIQQCRQTKKKWGSGDRMVNLYLNHLSSAIAFYKNLTLLLENSCGTNFTGLNGSVPSDVDPDEEHAQWIKAACYRCLLYMGDLARYQSEIDGNALPAVAFYSKAIALDPTNGSVFNQLAALAGEKNEGCDAAYYYWRCLTSPKPFAGVEQNLQRLLDKIDGKLKGIQNHEALRTKEDTVREFVRRRFLVKFLHIQKLLSPQFKSGDVKLGDLCQEVILDLEECLTYDLEHLKEADLKNEAPSPAGPRSHGLILPCDLMLKLGALAILQAYSLRLQGSANTPAATALALAVFSQLLHYCLERLTILLSKHCLRKLQTYNQQNNEPNPKDLCPPSLSFRASMIEFIKSPPIGLAFGFTDKKKLNKQRAKAKALDRRRKRPQRGPFSSGESGSESNSDTEQNKRESEDSLSDFHDLTDEEEEEDLLVSLSSSESEGEGDTIRGGYHDNVAPIGSKTSPNNHGKSKRRNIVLAASFNQSPIKPDPVDVKENSLQKSMATKKQLPTAPTKEELNRNAVDFLCSVVMEEVFLMVVRMFCDWLQANQIVIATCAQSSSKMWSRLAELLNFLPSNELLLETGHENLLDHSSHPALPEDEVLRGFAPLVRNQEFLDYSSTTKLSQQQLCVARLFNLQEFGHFVANLKTAPSFSFDKSTKKFTGPSQVEQEQKTKKIQEDLKKEEQSRLRQSQIMKAMAQRRLEDEVASLSSKKDAQSKPVTPFLLPDALTLCNNLHIIRKLLLSRQFIIIIARSVLDMLDSMKKGRENYAARDAIKFLEKAFEEKNKFLRPQAAEETVDPKAKRPHKTDLHYWNFMCLVKCASYFTKESLSLSLGRCSAILLVDKSVLNDAAPEEIKECIKQAKENSVDVDTPLSFYNHWNKHDKK